MIRDHEDLSGALHALADSESTSAAPTDAVLRRGRRAARNRILARSAATLGVLGLVGAGVAIGVTATQGTQQAPRISLAAAVRATSSDSYRFAETTTASKAGAGSATESCSGAVDPQQSVGRLVFDNGEENRVIGDDVYIREPGETWSRTVQPGSAMGNLSCSSEGSETVDPKELFASIKKHDGTVTFQGRRGTGADAVDAYTFRYQYQRWSDSPAISHVSGTVLVGVATDRVKEVDSTSVLTYHGTRSAAEKSVTTYSGYGDPVTVERPVVE